MYHIPVMPKEAAQYLINKSDGTYVDCTFGGGGHTSYLLNRFDNIKIIAFDWDKSSENLFIEKEKEFSGRVIFIRDNFKNIKEALLAIGIAKIDGILADFGVSSKQFDDLDRGFSFDSKVLDMRMDKRNPLTAKEIVNSYSGDELADIFYKYGEEYKAKKIVDAILFRRKRGIINSGLELKEIICSVKRAEGKTNPATKVFQALRIFINSELDNIQSLLSAAPQILSAGGRIAVISFHSLEDRLVKQNFKQNLADGIYKILTKRVIAASREEINLNRRSRSAKIRAAEKING